MSCFLREKTSGEDEELLKNALVGLTWTRQCYYECKAMEFIPLQTNRCKCPETFSLLKESGAKTPALQTTHNLFASEAS